MNTPQLVALCVGHSRKVDGRREGGAVSVGGLSEWNYNSHLATLIGEYLTNHRTRFIIVNDYQGNGYGAAQRWLAEHLKAKGVTVAVELHFNDADTTAANGHEWLYWGSSLNGKKLATSLHFEMCLVVPGIKSRGTKPKSGADRGAEFLSGTHCPAVIAEPFFGRNPSDWQVASTQQADIAKGIAEGILDFLD